MNHLRFAEVILISEAAEQLQKMFADVKRELKVGLDIIRTRLMFDTSRKNCTTNGEGSA